MRFSLLGPLEVRRGDTPVPIRGALRRTLLAALLLNRDAVVSTDHLSELLWGNGAQPAAAAPLHNQVMRLRQALGDDGDLIRAIAPGYLIRIKPDQLDLAEFTDLCATARQVAASADWQKASELYAESLGLWRGEILADVPALHAHASIPQLEEDRVVALRGRIEADLNLGRHDELVGELRTLTSIYPLRESFHAQLMLALQRSGRQAEALGVYRALRRATVDELGVEPGAAIQDLHAKILNADPSVALPPSPRPGPRVAPSSLPTPRQLPADTRLFAGRQTELDELMSLTINENPGSGTVVISAINGMGGVGKTALAIRAAHGLRERYPDGQLFIDLHGYSQNLEPVAPEDALDFLLRSLGVAPQAIPGNLDERATLYRSRLAETRTLIVLDNAINAAQVAPLLPAAPGCLVLVTSRNRLTSLEDAHLVALDVLPYPDAVALLREVAGTARATEIDQHPNAVADIITFCGRLPLAIRIVAARLRHYSTLTIEALAAELHEESGRLDRLQDDDRDLLSVFDSSIAVLADEQQRLFRFLGLVPGPDFDAYPAAHLIGTDLRTAETLLESLADHNLLIQYTPGRYRLHDLLRVHASGLAAQDEESDTALDRLFDFYVHTAQAAELARHKRTAPEKAVPVRVPTPDFAYRDQAPVWMHNERANLLALLDHREVGARRTASLTAAMIPLLSFEGPWTLVTDLSSRAVAAAQHMGDRLAEANALAQLSGFTGRTGNPDAAAAHATRALAIFREIGHRQGEADALHQLGLVAFGRSRFAEALEPTEQALAIFEELGNRERAAAMLWRLGAVTHAAGRNDLASDHLTRAIAVNAEIGSLTGEANCLLVYSRTRYALGDYNGVHPLNERALQLFRQSGFQQGVANALQEIARQQLLTGGYGKAVSMLEEALVIHRELGFQLGEGNVYWELGRIRFALGDSAEALRFHQQALDIFEGLNSSMQSIALREIARVHHVAGDQGTAAELARRALSIAVEASELISELEIRNFIATLESDMDGPEFAVKVFRENADKAVELGHPLERARALEGMARCEIRLDRRESGLDHLRQAVDLYERMGVVEYGPAAAYLAEVEGSGSAFPGAAASTAGDEDDEDPDQHEDANG